MTMANLTVGPLTDYPTVAAAMAAASPGDTITLAPGYVDPLVAAGDILTFAGNGANTIVAGEGNNQIITGDGVETITSGSGNDTMLTGDGASTITTTGGDNFIETGTGVDTILVGTGQDTILAGDGANTITGLAGDKVIVTGVGADTITVTSGNNMIMAGDGANTITATSGGNVICTGDNVDTISVTSGDNVISAGNGANTISATSGHNVIFGGANVDTIVATGGGNYIDGGDGANTLTTGGGNDTVVSGVDTDTIATGGGDDDILITGGTDVIAGGTGSDTLIVDYSEATSDVITSAPAGTAAAGYAGTMSGMGAVTYAGIEDFDITSGTGNDAINTGAGDDTINSGTGNDAINAGAGSDYIYGNAGDVINGGDGADTLNLGLTPPPHTIAYDTGNGQNGVVTYTDTGETLTFTNIENVVYEVPLDSTVTIIEPDPDMCDPFAGGAPVANPDTAGVKEDNSVIIDVLGNDTDPNGDELTVTGATAPNGTVVINDDGTLSYTPNPDFNGEDEITYTVQDPDGNAATGTATVAVYEVNDAPVAADDEVSTLEDTLVTIDVLGNDTDVEGDELTVTLATAENGTVVINDDGTLEYTPNLDFNGDDTITYTVSDPDGETSTAQVAVSVTADGSGGGDGVVDGEEYGEVMIPGYTDPDGDQIDGDDGINDVINGNGGSDTINAGEGDDTIDGGEGNDRIDAGEGDDTIIRSEGYDQLDGGSGEDVLAGDGEGHVNVRVDNNGDGDVFHQESGGYSRFDSIENFVGDEIDGEDDKIHLTDNVAVSDIDEEISGLSDDAIGYFFPEEGGTVSFGPDQDYSISDILDGESPGGDLPTVGPIGEYFITDGEEDGQIGDISFENYENIYFGVENDPASLMRSPEEEARIADGAPVYEEEEEEMADMF